MNRNTLSSPLGIMFLVVSGLLASMVKCSFMVGSHAAFFSLSNSIIPLSGLLAGYTGIISLVLTRIFYASLFSSAGILVNVLPNMIASLYLISRSRLRAFIPLLCIVLFLVHPVGRHAPLYTCYWIIPFIHASFNIQTMFFRFFATTLVAHAAGSIIWLYTVPMTAMEWNALIPIVFIERIIIVSGMIAFYVLAGIMAALFSLLLVRITGFGAFRKHSYSSRNS